MHASRIAELESRVLLMVPSLFFSPILYVDNDLPFIEHSSALRDLELKERLCHLRTETIWDFLVNLLVP